VGTGFAKKDMLRQKIERDKNHPALGAHRGRKPLPPVSSAESLFAPSGESAVTPMTWFAATCGFGGAPRAVSASIRTCFAWKCWIFYRNRFLQRERKIEKIAAIVPSIDHSP
jgi:hypothetical protein